MPPNYGEWHHYAFVNNGSQLLGYRDGAVVNTYNCGSCNTYSGPGYGLNEAAQKALLKFKFKPAIRGGEAVSTDLTYTYTFQLD